MSKALRNHCALTDGRNEWCLFYGLISAGYRHVQLRSSSNQPLDLSTLFICCKLEDNSWNSTSADATLPTTVTATADPAGGPPKKAASRGAYSTTVLRPRDDILPTALDKEVRCIVKVTVKGKGITLI